MLFWSSFWLVWPPLPLSVLLPTSTFKLRREVCKSSELGKVTKREDSWNSGPKKLRFCRKTVCLFCCLFSISVSLFLCSAMILFSFFFCLNSYTFLLPTSFTQSAFFCLYTVKRELLPGPLASVLLPVFFFFCQSGQLFVLRTNSCLLPVFQTKQYNCEWAIVSISILSFSCVFS